MSKKARDFRIRVLDLTAAEVDEIVANLEERGIQYDVDYTKVYGANWAVSGLESYVAGLEFYTERGLRAYLGW